MFNASAPPDYGLDWRYSHGFGAGQTTVFPKDGPCPGKEAEGRGSIHGGKCYSIKDLLTTSSQVEAMVAHYKACWKKGAGDAAAGYVCYQGKIEKDNPQIVKRVDAYQACINAGG